MAWRIVISPPAGARPSVRPVAGFNNEAPPATASAPVIKSLLEDIGYNLTVIKIGLISIERRIKYIAKVKLPAVIRLLLTFYKGFFFFSFLITLACAFLYWEYGPHILKVLFWLKTATLYLTFYFIRSYRQKEFYYYRNLGIRDAVLWGVTLGADAFLFIVFLIFSSWCR
jgi:hypothetical protein